MQNVRHPASYLHLSEGLPDELHLLIKGRPGEVTLPTDNMTLFKPLQHYLQPSSRSSRHADSVLNERGSKCQIPDPIKSDSAA